MSHHRADDSPPGAPLLPAAVALPGGPDGASGPLRPPCPAGFSLGVGPVVRGLVRAPSAVEAGPNGRTVGAVWPCGTSNGRSPNAAPAARIRDMGDPAEPVGVEGAEVAVVDLGAGTGGTSAGRLTGVTPVFGPTTVDGTATAGAASGLVAGVGSTGGTGAIVEAGLEAGALGASEVSVGLGATFAAGVVAAGAGLEAGAVPMGEAAVGRGSTVGACVVLGAGLVAGSAMIGAGTVLVGA